MQYDTMETCQEKITQMKKLMQQFKELSHIQFPIEDDEEKQFQHYTINQIQDTLRILENEIDKLQHDLWDYNARISIINATDKDLEDTLNDIEGQLCDMHISAAKCDILYKLKDRIMSEMKRRKAHEQPAKGDFT